MADERTAKGIAILAGAELFGDQARSVWSGIYLRKPFRFTVYRVLIFGGVALQERVGDWLGVVQTASMLPSPM